jgi:hypothetical protein
MRRHSLGMSDEKESPEVPALAPAVDPAPTPAGPVKDSAVFDDFAEQASRTAVWPDAVRAQLPKKANQRATDL